MYEQDIVALLTGETGAALSAAENIIRYDLGPLDSSRSLLPWQLQTQGDSNPENCLLTLQIEGWQLQAHVTLSQARTAFAHGQSLSALLLYGVLASEVTEVEPALPSTDSFRRSINAAESSQRRVQDVDGRVRVDPPDITRIRTLLRRDGVAGLVGSSASGKSVLADLLAKEYGDRGANTLWLDFADPQINALACVAAMMRTPQGPSAALMVCDDVQSNPSAASFLLRLNNATLGSPNRHVLALGWLDARDVLEGIFGVGRVLVCEGRELCKRIMTAPAIADSGVRHELLRLCKSNALIAESAVSIFYDVGRAPRPAEIADRAFNIIAGDKHLAPAELALLWRVACLAMFEIDLNLSYLTRRDREVVQELIRKKALRQRGEFISFGHRTLARFVARHIRENRLVDALSGGTPLALAVEYLRMADDLQVQTTLDRLDLLAFETRNYGSRDGALLAEAWVGARILARYIASHVTADPGWGDNVASAVFSAEALAELGMTEEWRRVAEYVRGRWLVDKNASLPSYINSPPAESIDFEEIIKCMREEDRDHADHLLQADEIDQDRFHRTWVLGLLMGFEGTALEPNEDRIIALRHIVARAQNPDGSFYPARVPWVTARVCLGLCAMGETLATSTVLREAARWLMLEYPAGARRDRIWHGGTGTWNSDVNTTALVLLALATMGTEKEGNLEVPLSHIQSVRHEWTTVGQEVDCAQALEAALMLGESWASFSDVIAHLISWARDSRSWEKALLLASETQDESSKVPYVARALITLVWQTARTELPHLLAGLAGTEEGEIWQDLDASSRIERLMREAHAALTGLSEYISSQIKDREILLDRNGPIDEVIQQWELWRERSSECSRLMTAVRDFQAIGSVAENQALLEEVDEFGLAVQGFSWKAAKS